MTNRFHDLSDNREIGTLIATICNSNNVLP
jgi:hypothetical protein